MLKTRSQQHVQYKDATLDTRPVHESARLRHYACGSIERSAAVAHGCYTARLPPTSGTPHAATGGASTVDFRNSCSTG